jgi:biopolymer transport protein ExbB/biopolymer transport protein TolQ
MSFDLISMWNSAGYVAKAVIVILLLCSIWTLKVAVEKFLAYNASRKESTEYLPHLVNYLKQGKIQEAIDASKKFSKAHIAKVVSSGLLEYQSTKDQGELVMLDSTRRALEMAMAVTSAELRKGLGALGTIATTSPFIGLFGTVFGIINAFHGIATAGSGGLAAVSAGIAEALITTGVGIGVAIIAVVLFNYFTERLERFQVEMTNASSELIDYIVKRHGHVG